MICVDLCRHLILAPRAAARTRQAVHAAVRVGRRPLRGSDRCEGPPGIPLVASDTGRPSSAFLGPGPGRGACGRAALAWVHGDLEDPSRAPEARPRAPPCAGAARRRAAFARRTRRMSAALKVSHGALELLRESVAGCVRVASAPRGTPAEPRGARPPLLRGRAAAGRRAWPSTPPTPSAPRVHVVTLGGRLARAWVVGYRPTPLRHSSQIHHRALAHGHSHERLPANIPSSTS